MNCFRLKMAELDMMCVGGGNDTLGVGLPLEYETMGVEHPVNEWFSSA
jgi:hypothetical protein